MKGSKILIVLLALLLLTCSFRAKVTYADPISPIIEFNGVQLNATAYRFYNGNTLNFTFHFSTEAEITKASFAENWTLFNAINYTGIFEAYMNISVYQDGEEGRTYYFLGGSSAPDVIRQWSGTGRHWSKSTFGMFGPGDHVIKKVILYVIQGAAEGYIELNFLSPVILELEEVLSWPWPDLTQQSLSFLGGATLSAAVIGTVFFIKKRRNAKRSAPQIEA